MEYGLLPGDGEGVEIGIATETPPGILIALAKGELASTDYLTLKWLDGELTDEEYEPHKQRRAELREQVRLLEPAVF